MLAVTFTYIQEASRFYVARSLPTSLTSFPTLLPLFNPATPASLLVLVTSESLDLPSAHTFLHCSQCSLQSGICSCQHRLLRGHPHQLTTHPFSLLRSFFPPSTCYYLILFICTHTDARKHPHSTGSTSLSAPSPINSSAQRMLAGP